jgi:hypothetical protein
MGSSADIIYPGWMQEWNRKKIYASKFNRKKLSEPAVSTGKNWQHLKYITDS